VKTHIPISISLLLLFCMATSDSIMQVHQIHAVRVAEGRYDQQRLAQVNAKQRKWSLATIGTICILFAISVTGMIYFWKRRTKELIHSSLTSGWNHELFIEQVNSGAPYRDQEAFFSTLFSAANLAYTGLIEWLNQHDPSLSNTDIALTCLLFSGLRAKQIVALYPTWNPASIHTHHHRLRKKLNIDTTLKNPLSLRNHLTQVYLQSKM